MARTVLRLETEDVLRALETVDPVEVLAETLIGRAIGQAREPRRGPVPWTGAAAEAGYVLSGELPGELGCAMPAAILRELHAATLAAIAIRELLIPGGATVAVLGTRFAVQAQLAVLARYVPDIVHVAARITDKDCGDAPGGVPLEPWLVEQLDLAGIGVSVATSLADALFGANLVVAASEDALTEGVEQATVHDLVRGTLLVNTSGHDLPTTLLDHVDQVYVDDLTLLPRHTDRYVVARHLATTADTDRAGDDPRPPTIAADLGLLLAGTCAGRVRQDDVVVVELLSTRDPDIHLATTIAEAAVRCDLGQRVTA